MAHLRLTPKAFLFRLLDYGICTAIELPSRAACRFRELAGIDSTQEWHDGIRVVENPILRGVVVFVVGEARHEVHLHHHDLQYW